ncbi:MAG: rRNA maturation RNase YbeY [Bacilli bacterium]|nr:rRNA maturation RNase YbeY [Bacilli bacterium]MBO6194880.1 rRNA maturation RNase YbeY [Bacilli bacterium]
MGDFKMREVEVFNETNEKLEEIDELSKLFPFLLDYFNLDNVVCSVIIVDNKKIHEINKEYRNIDRETDVISFALEDDETIPEDDIRVLGDIYISIDKAKSQAEEYGHSLKRELCFLMTHGFLHLLGYDHMKKEDEEIMFPLQEKILEEYGVRR